MIEIALGDVHIWHASLDVPAWQFPEYEKILSPDERERANRYVRPIHSARFTIGRGMLREVLSRYIDMPPHELAFSYGRQGKPELNQTGDIRFNVAHSEAQIMIGVTYGQAIGIDIEQVRTLPDMDQLSQRFLPALEGMYRDELVFHDQRTVFFQQWTRTEALLKASGTGLSGLQQLEALDLTNWTICNIDAAQGFVAALAVEGEIKHITRMEL